MKYLYGTLSGLCLSGTVALAWGWAWWSRNVTTAHDASFDWWGSGAATWSFLVLLTGAITFAALCAQAARKGVR